MQSKTFGRLSIVVVVIVSFFVLINISRQAVDKTPFPEELVVATSTATPVAQISTSTLSLHIKASRGVIRAMVATSSIELERGLSGQISLPRDAGMLFVFATSTVPGFWMKDMGFPIDMVWVDSAKVVTGILSNISPDTYPQVFSPNGEVKYVLEVSAGTASEFGIATGTKLVF